MSRAFTLLFNPSLYCKMQAPEGRKYSGDCVTYISVSIDFLSIFLSTFFDASKPKSKAV